MKKNHNGKDHRFPEADRDYGKPGRGGFNERVDFQEVVGSWVSPDGTEQLETTRGIIHHGEEGIHIIPAHPRYPGQTSLSEDSPNLFFPREYTKQHSLQTLLEIELYEALLGRISPNMVAIFYNLDEPNLTADVYWEFTQSPSERDLQLLRGVQEALEPRFSPFLEVRWRWYSGEESPLPVGRRRHIYAPSKNDSNGWTWMNIVVAVQKRLLGKDLRKLKGIQLEYRPDAGFRLCFAWRGWKQSKELMLDVQEAIQSVVGDRCVLVKFIRGSAPWIFRDRRRLL